MAGKNVLIFIHGIGQHQTGWSKDEKDGPQKALEAASEYYSDRFPKDNPLSNSLKFVEIRYDDIFEKVRPDWNSKNQYVILRPSFSPVLKFDGNENSSLDAALVVEPVGYIRYINNDYSNWVGVSTMVTLTNDNGVGYGTLLRYGNWELGAAYHDKNDDILLYVSVDLYDYIMGKDKKKVQANEYLDRLSEYLLHNTKN